VPSLPPLPPDRPDLAARYGVGARRRQALVPLGVLAALGLIVVGLFVWGGALRAGEGVRAAIRSYDAQTATSITVTLEVVRPPGTPVVCDVAAVGEGRLDVGAVRIEVPPDPPQRILVPVTVETAGPPLAARLLGCRTG
jgi:hypothetical protein